MSVLQIKRPVLPRLLVLLLLVAASFLAYGNSLKGDFVWDDRALFVENYARWQSGNLKELLTSQDNLFEDRYTGYYRPLPNLTFLVDRYLWKQDPTGYHLTNVIFHALTVLVVYWMVRLLVNRPGVAFLSALCFAWHPVNTECVAWINGRNNVIAGGFFVLSFVSYLSCWQGDRPKLRYCGLSILAFCLSILSKEYALTLPILVACHQILYGSASIKARLGKIAARTGPYVAVIVAYLTVRSMVLPGRGVKFMHWDTFWMRVLTVPKTLTIYLKLLVFPVNLTTYHETTLVESLADPVLWATLGLVLCVGGLSYVMYGRSKPSCFALSWVFVTLIPVLNLVPLSDQGRFVAERYLYLPSVGFSFLAGQLVIFFWDRWQRRKKAWVSVFPLLGGCVLLQWYLFGTLNRNLAWRNNLSLWTDTVALRPASYEPYFNLAVAYRERQDFEAAVAAFEQAYEKAAGIKDKGLVMANIAFVHYLQKDYDRAKSRLEEARLLIPGNSGVYNLMGNVHLMEQDYEMALEQYENALKLDPQCKDSLISQGMAYLKMGKLEKTIQHLEKVKTMVGQDGRLYYYLGSAYEKKGMGDLAAKNYSRYLELLPHDRNRNEVARRLETLKAAPQWGSGPQ